MGLREGQLHRTVLNRLSIDEFEPKTGDIKEVIVVGFYLTQKPAAEDLYHFFNNSIIETRDVENSNNPNEDGHYMVFIELERDTQFLSTLKSLLNETSRIIEFSHWKAKTHLMDDYMSLNDPEFEEFVITDPDKYMTREEWDEMKKQNQRDSRQETIEQLLSETNLLDVQVRDNELTLVDNRNSLGFNIIAVGPAETVMSELAINEAAINTEADYSLGRKLKGMMAETQVIPIRDYWVFFNPANENVIVTKAS